MSMVAAEVDGRGVATLTLDRAEKHNAMSGEMCDEIAAAAAALGADPAVRVVVLAGAGRTFCAGGDLGWMRAQFDADRAGRMAEARRLADMLNVVNTLPKPVIARVHGAAYGGGIGMMSVADCVVAAVDARFGLTETRLGIIPATISPYVLARMGEGRARTVFFSARVFGAEEAKELGLVHRIALPENLDAAVEAEVAPYLSVAPGAAASAKRLARSLGPRIDAAVIEATIVALADVWETEEAQAGLAAFFDKRPAPWA
ncbi:crotonase/enoyl-CoA hydratase family protein [Amaricoccus sp.]|uniref:crotonase/enoyl-CoA hydratase family protein n=1 Tax=Amaricoccus sp. TaxID=1872485 RepID=UPI001B7B25B5|nr:crotonase/enoyl-CoA hydratase family protein [Amaricoccus sp.]MBP7242770.1 crotonase/enoyl-CoA hydratase family protein [Amaricoccus sp.]